MASLNDLANSTYVKLLAYGDSGSGKTCLAGSFPGPVHICDFDGKVNSLASFLKGSRTDISYESYTPVDARGTSARKFNDDMGKLRNAKSFPYQTLVIDSMTTFSDEGMNYLMEMNPGVKRMQTGVVRVPAQQDYGIARIWFKQMIQTILTFPCNVIFTAHIHVEKDELSGAIIRSPMLAGKLKQELPIYFEEVYRAYVEGGKHYLQTKPDRSYSIIRSQIPGMPDKIESKYGEITKKR
jgi:hypothetical protein